MYDLQLRSIFFQLSQIPREFFALNTTMYPEFHRIQPILHTRSILSFRMCDHDTSKVQVLVRYCIYKLLDFYHKLILFDNLMFFALTQSKMQLVPRPMTVLKQFHVHVALLELSLRNFSFYRTVPQNQLEEYEDLGCYWTM